MHRRRLGMLGLVGLCLAVASPSPAANTNAARNAAAVLDPAGLAERIDHHISAKLKQRDAKPAATADDAEFLRRVYLDLAGRVPRGADARAFLDDKSPDRRQKLIEKLL